VKSLSYVIRFKLDEFIQHIVTQKGNECVGSDTVNFTFVSM
jgi:hypothetical protein